MQLLTRGLFGVVGVLALGVVPARAQMAMPGGGRSLGGYGAQTIGSYYTSAGGGYLPYTGGGSGFVPYRGGPGAGMGAQPIPRQLPETPIGGVMMAETPIGGASLPGGMASGARGGMAMDSRSRRRTFAPFGSDILTGMGGGMTGMPLTRQGGMGGAPAGPGFGYPFRMPPSLPGAAGGGMAMP